MTLPAIFYLAIVATWITFGISSEDLLGGWGLAKTVFLPLVYVIGTVGLIFYVGRGIIRGRNEKLVVYIGIPILYMHVLLLPMFTLYGMAGGRSLMEVVRGLDDAIDLGVLFVNCVLILLCCVVLFGGWMGTLFSRSVLFWVVIVAVVALIVQNVYLIRRNGVAIFNGAFWIYLLVYLFSERRLSYAKSPSEGKSV